MNTPTLPPTIAAPSAPEHFRLPPKGRRDPYYGFSRSWYYDSEARGLLKLVRLRKPGHSRGIVLVARDSVAALIRDLGGSGI
jgi:hypothetical protein